jgi:hypothetical protein
LRGEKVLLDADLARLYGVTTKALNQAVKRNSSRFPKDFMFSLATGRRDRGRSSRNNAGMVGAVTMRSDPIVEEIRRIRQQHTEKFHADLHAICEDLRREERQSTRRYVTFPPRRVVPLATATRSSPANETI